jgi:hypothetical protein
MQPYVFPYVGYFQLIAAVDVFVFYNDVNFIKKGWINRNRILLNGSDYLLTVPCAEVSQNKRICDIRIALDSKGLEKLLTTLQQAYRKAPYFDIVYPLIRNAFMPGHTHIDQLAMASVREVCRYLGIGTELHESRDWYGNESMKREDRLIDICLKEKVSDYINPIGGKEIYSKAYFMERGVELRFLKTNFTAYDQFGGAFVPGLSIIDVMMFNEKETILQYLRDCELV